MSRSSKTKGNSPDMQKNIAMPAEPMYCHLNGLKMVYYQVV